MTLPPGEPLFFGANERPLFGWLHRPTAGTRVTIGVVLCNPFGYEAISAHRTIKQCAQTIAAAGIPAFRFDYDGAGDSAGTDLDPGRLSAWISSVHRAADILRRQTGCERLVFFGIRLGATLAALAASERTDVQGLVALAAVVNAKAYMRELRALQMAGRNADPATPPSDDGATEVTGFVLTAETRAAVAAIDLAKLERRPADHVLILDRHDLPGNERWAEHLQASGAAVERQAVPGYAEMMLSPHSAVVPAEMLSLAIAWLGGVSRLPRPVNETVASAPSYLQNEPPTLVFGSSIELPAADESGSPIVEATVALGPDRRGFGILTIPHAKGAMQPSGGQGILLLNAGGTHHIGPNRMYVALARRWASRGHAVLRMDFSGIGDSAPPAGEPDNLIYTATAADDIARGARYLREKTGATQCCAMGLCSGAYHALKAAVGGVPLDSVVMMNPLTFFWKDGMSLDAPLPEERVIAETQRYQKTALQKDSWLKLLRGEVNIPRILRIIGRRTHSKIAHFCRDVARRLDMPLKDDLGRELEMLAQRRTRMLFVFAADDPGIELLRAQAGATVKRLRRRGQLRIEVIGEADHTFTARRARGRLIPTLETMLDKPPIHG